MEYSKLLNYILDGRDLNEKQMTEIMQNIMQGKLTDSQIAAFLVALKAKGESLIEVVSAVKVMRSLSTKVLYKNSHLLVDTVGCGDGSSTFNISTCCAFVCAAAGIPVAKHGNRSNTSASGSSDLLAQAQVNLDLTPEQVSQCIDQCGVGFLFAPKHHSAMKYAITARKEMGIRTLFNLLGPLTNPAGAMNQVIGAFSEKWLEIMAQALQILGSKKVLIVHARDNLDEISTSAITDVVELNNDKISRWTIDPADYSCDHPNLANITIDNPAQSLSMISEVLQGNNSNKQAMDIIVLNVAAAFLVGGKVSSYDEGVAFAKDFLQTGKAYETFNHFVQFTHQFS